MNDLRPIENARKQRGNSLINRAGAACAAGNIDNRDSVTESKGSQTTGAVSGCKTGAHGVTGYYHATVKS